VRVLLFGFDAASLQGQVLKRVGQCVLTSPGSACFAGLDGGTRLKLGGGLRYFGDGHQVAKRLDGRRFWRIPVMDGEFLCEHDTGTAEGAVGGGNLLLLGRDFATTLAVAEAAADAARRVRDVILPFPGGIARSGSKIGSRYKGVVASTNEAFCPTLKARPGSLLPTTVGAVLELVIDGLSAAAVAAAMRAALHAATAGGSGGLLRVTAGNYGGQLGRHHFALRDLVA
jgi:formylmethanofuran--tetrahydromethanopterin N-formyltransferase